MGYGEVTSSSPSSPGGNGSNVSLSTTIDFLVFRGFPMVVGDGSLSIGLYVT